MYLQWKLQKLDSRYKNTLHVSCCVWQLFITEGNRVRICVLKYLSVLFLQSRSWSQSDFLTQKYFYCCLPLLLTPSITAAGAAHFTVIDSSNTSPSAVVFCLFFYSFSYLNSVTVFNSSAIFDVHLCSVHFLCFFVSRLQNFFICLTVGKLLLPSYFSKARRNCYMQR